MGCVAWMERPPLAAAQSGVALQQRRNADPGLRDRETAVPPSGLRPRYALALGDLVRSMAGHCSETAGSGVSLPVMRSGTMA